ncbi:hypothetical protein J3R30DRAFT_630999 [Lentinula aciculospora]|uniref:RING-type domain-containing protein n=1 Tax=Lentinula aciculospora TaxID=153920 RepID=A0A9W9A5L3_9AGAR|nr:hypothetical protein J3R30DRAFT_630999 [Lentinula aciculospora]
MPYGHCQVCLAYYPISGFQILPCGHGGCKSCLDQMFDSATKIGSCWMCRQDVHRSKAHRIHLELVDSKVAILQDTIEGLGRMDANVPSISVNRANARIKRTVDELECDNERADLLRQAIADFEERIIPIYTLVEVQAKEINRLQEQISQTQGTENAWNDIRESSRKKDVLITTLRSDLDQSNKDGRQALSVMEKLTTDYLALKNQNELGIEEKKKLEDDNRNLRGLLQRHAKAAQLRKHKVQALKEEIASLKERNETLEQSQSVVSDESLPVFLSDDYADENFPSSSSAQVASPVRNKSKFSGLSQITNDLHFADVDDFDSGMPGPGFSSDWKMSSATKPAKRKAESSNFPIPLNKRGQPTVSVQTGPVRLRRIP